jgi:uncharacterized protein (TIGR00369 family)
MSEQESLPLPDNVLAMLNENRGGFNEMMGLKFVSATLDEVVGELQIGPGHSQPYGVVHGGVYASMVETLSSVGAALHALTQGKNAVGLENTTSFLRATRGGKLRGVARPLVRGRRSHVWEVTITDESDRAVATGRVRMLILEGDAKLAGETVAVRS